MKVLIVLHWLFVPPKGVDRIVVVEHPYYMTRLPFHKKKLILHRASMKAYAARYKAEYVDVDKFHSFAALVQKGDTMLSWDPVDHAMRREMKAFDLVANPSFPDEAPSTGTTHAAFYRAQRRHLDVGMKRDGGPCGGKWSFDSENRSNFIGPSVRQDFPDGIAWSYDPMKPRRNKWITEAIAYVEKKFPNNFGESAGFYLPVTHAEAADHLQRWLESGLKTFGPYQDAVSREIPVGAHSLLAPLLNVGLLTVPQILRALEGRRWGASVEGFVRQIIGWRSYIRFMYDQNSGGPPVRGKNPDGPAVRGKNPDGPAVRGKNPDGPAVRGKNPDGPAGGKWAGPFSGRVALPPDWFAPPKDTAHPVAFMVDKAWRTGYLHHIERLMYVGAYMLMSGIKPADAYDWFMVATVDSYDWVMVPNVYGMVYYGGGMMTRPYFSSSNYILKMSDFGRGPWVADWDQRYHAFVDRHRELLRHNYATARMVQQLRKK